MKPEKGVLVGMEVLGYQIIFQTIWNSLW
ncbi:hypothetical protein Nmel_003761 [Mimus melanotis]